MQKDGTVLVPYAIYKNKYKMYQRIKCKTGNRKTPERNHRQ